MKNFRLLPFTVFLTTLLLAGCDKPAEIALARLERENFRFTPDDFVRAAGLGDEVNVENFITAGMDVNAKNPDEYTALMMAAERGHTRTVERLLNAGAAPDIQGKNGWTALMYASFGNQTDAVAALVGAGADPDLRDNNGWTALMQAVYQGYDRVVEILAPRSVDGLDRALLVATMMGHDKVIGTLLDAGADIDNVTEDGETALMLAAQKGRTETTRVLLARGAAKSLTNNLGETAETIARTRGHEEIAILIAEAAVTHPDPVPTPTPAETSVATAAPAEDAPAETSPPAEPISETLPLPVETAGSVKTSIVPESEWFVRHGLDLDTPGVLDADPDGDGFTNREEYLSDTDPHDPASRPARAIRLRLADIAEERFPLLLDSVEGDTAVLRRTDGSGSVHRLSAGQAVPGLPFTVERVRARAHSDKTSEGQAADVSEATLKNSGNGESITLVRGLAARGAGSYAQLHLAGEGRTFKVRQSEDFALPDDGDRKYRVVDIRPTQVVITETASGEVFTIERTEN